MGAGFRTLKMPPYMTTTLTLHCTSVQVVEPDAAEPPMKAILNNIELDELFAQVPVEEVVKYYGSYDLLKEIPIKEIKEYLEQ